MVELGEKAFRARQLVAETVVAPDGMLDAFEGLASLVDKSLLLQAEWVDDEPRYAMLETVRRYALERLMESEEYDTLRERHALYYTWFAERCDRDQQGPEQAASLDRMAREHDNLRAALDWSTARAGRGEPDNINTGTTGPADVAVRLAIAMHEFWETRGFLSEGRARLLPVLRAAEHASDRRAYARALFAAGRMAMLQRDDDAAAMYVEVLILPAPPK